LLSGPQFPGFNDFLILILNLAREREDLAFACFGVLKEMAKRWEFMPQLLPPLVDFFDQYGGPDVDHSLEEDILEAAGLAFAVTIEQFPADFGPYLDRALHAWTRFLTGGIQDSQSGIQIIEHLLAFLRAGYTKLYEHDEVERWLTYVVKGFSSTKLQESEIRENMREFLDSLNGELAELIATVANSTLVRDHLWTQFWAVMFSDHDGSSPLRVMVGWLEIVGEGHD
jgi:hypothetical protein